MKRLPLTVAALVAIAGPSLAGESLAKQVERHFARDETGHDAVVLPEIDTGFVLSSAQRNVETLARQILATGDSWTDAFVPGSGTLFASPGMARSAIDHPARALHGTLGN